MHQSEELYRVIGLYSCRLDAWLVRADVPRERAGTRRRGECRHVARADVTADTRVHNRFYDLEHLVSL